MDEQKTNQNQEQNQNEAPQTSPQSKKGLPFVVKFIICLLVASTIIGIIAALLAHVPYIGYTFSIIGSLSLFVAVPTAYYFASRWEHKENPQKSSESANNQTATRVVAENPGRFFLFSFLYFILIVLLVAGGSLIMTMEACRGQNDCALGWIWGFVMVPVSGVIALILSPILATATIKAQKKKNDNPYGKPTK